MGGERVTPERLGAPVRHFSSGSIATGLGRRQIWPHVRHAPIATDSCSAAKFHNVPTQVSLSPMSRAAHVGWASHFVAKAATPKPIGRRRAALHASDGSADHPAIISGKTAQGRRGSRSQIKFRKRPHAKYRGSLAWMLYPRTHFDTFGKSAAPFQHRRDGRAPVALG
jgi:hypothetical protein